MLFRSVDLVGRVAVSFISKLLYIFRGEDISFLELRIESCHTCSDDVARGDGEDARSAPHKAYQHIVNGGGGARQQLGMLLIDGRDEEIDGRGNHRESGGHEEIAQRPLDEAEIVHAHAEAAADDGPHEGGDEHGADDDGGGVGVEAERGNEDGEDEICEDLWTPCPPSTALALGGAELILNLSASDDIIGKYAYLKSLVGSQSARCICAYAYASAGFGESSTDLVFDGKLFVAENGRMLACNRRWQSGNQLTVTDVDVEAIRRDRIHNGSFADSARRCEAEVFVSPVHGGEDRRPQADGLMRSVDPHPFVPSGDSDLQERCEEIINIQVAGLAQRLSATGCKCLVIGISGGLDSTLALLVATRAFDRLQLDRSGIVGVTMPGFGTTDRTHDNAVTLMKALGVAMREISIVPAVNLHFQDIGHDPSVHDVTYENSQARQRTLLLMDIANQSGGMVLVSFIQLKTIFCRFGLIFVFLLYKS